MLATMFLCSLRWADFYLLTEMLLLDSALAFCHQPTLRAIITNSSMKLTALTGHLLGKLMRMWFTRSHDALFRRTDGKNVSQISVPGIDRFLLSKWFVFISWTWWNCINDYISHFVLDAKNLSQIFSLSLAMMYTRSNITSDFILVFYSFFSPLFPHSLFFFSLSKNQNIQVRSRK